MGGDNEDDGMGEGGDGEVMVGQRYEQCLGKGEDF